MSFKFNSIEEAVEDIKNGKVIIVVDDEDRENEGDFLTAARNSTPALINFMATHGKGLICAPLSEDLCDKLGLEMMVQSNSAAYETPFTVSIDLIGHGCTTGISASDRSKTVLSLINPNTRPEELGKPGHIFPLRARKGGVLRRAGHTEAAVDLSRMAGYEEAGVIVEILNEDGTMARLPELIKIAKKFDLKIISIEDLIKYRIKNETHIKRLVDVHLPTEIGEFQLHAYKDENTNMDHLVLHKVWQTPPFVDSFMDGCVAAKEAADAEETHANVRKTSSRMHTGCATSDHHEHPVRTNSSPFKSVQTCSNLVTLVQI